MSRAGNLVDKAYNQAYYAKNKVQIDAKNEAWRESNKEHVAEVKSAYYFKNKDSDKERRVNYHKEYQKKNAVKIKAYKHEYYLKNKKDTIPKNVITRKKRRENDPLFKFTDTVRCLIGGAIRRLGYKKNSRTEAILGCTFEKFAEHLEKQFKPGMNWLNHSLHGWHIDHIIPMASAKTEEDVVRLNHYTNLQPLWASENMAKGDKIVASQPINIVINS